MGRNVEDAMKHIQTWEKEKDMKLLLRNIHLTMIFTMQKNWLMNFCSTLRVTRSNVVFFIKCGFSLENIQPSPVENDQPIKNSRYWSTEPYQTKLFNDFIYLNLRESILKRVINNGLTGNS